MGQNNNDMEQTHKTPTIGEATGALLRSLRAFETAQTEFETAMLAEFGPKDGRDIIEGDRPKWDTVRDRLKYLINENVWTWTTGPNAANPL